jgi:hypothetical protein
LIEALTTIDVDDEVVINVTDALLMIASAINRYAAIYEKAQERHANSAERFETYITGNGRPQ